MSQTDPGALYSQGKDLLDRGELKAAMARLRDAAHAGHADAAHLVAMLLAAEMGVAEAWDYVLAYTWRAAKAGHLTARHSLAFLAGDRATEAAIKRGESLADGTWDRLHGAISLAGLRRTPQKTVLRASPLIAMLHAFVTPAMCDWIREKARPRLARALVYDHTAGRNIPDAARSNSGMHFTFADLDLVLMLTADAINQAVGCRFRDHESSSVFHYAPGQEFKPHYDFINPPRPGETPPSQRQFTLLIYLNDDYEGGETVFPRLDQAFKGRKGDALLFRNVDETGRPDLETLHAGSPTSRGEKWVFSQWIRQAQDQSRPI